MSDIFKKLAHLGLIAGGTLFILGLLALWMVGPEFEDMAVLTLVLMVNGLVVLASVIMLWVYYRGERRKEIDTPKRKSIDDWLNEHTPPS